MTNNSTATQTSTSHTGETGSDSKSSRIIKNVVMNWLCFATAILTGFFMSPFLIRHLGDSVYGVWVLIGSLIGHFALLDFGTQFTIVKRVAEFRARGDQEAINRLLTAALAIFAVMGIFSLGVTGFLALRFNHLFHTPLDDTTAAIAMAIMGLNFVLGLCASAFLGALRGYQRYDLDSAVTSLLILVRSALIVILLMQGYGILALALVTFTFDVTRVAYLTYCTYRINPAIRISRAYLTRSELRGIYSYSSSFFFIAIGNQINFLTDSIVIGMFLSTASVTIYFIANRLVIYLRDLVMEMVGALMPAVSDLHASQDEEQIRKLHVISTKYTLLIALPVSGVLFILGDNFITLWVGKGFHDSVLILHILTVAILGHLFVMPTSSVLTGMGQHHIVARFTIAQALTNLVLSLLLVKPLGLAGVALSTAISMVGFALIALPIYFRYYLKLSISEHLRRSLLAPLAIQPPFIAVLLLLKEYAPPSSLLMFFLATGITFMPYGVLAFLFCLSEPERQKFLSLTGKFGFKGSPRPPAERETLRKVSVENKGSG
jgi:O-antigen/teichoic acid export membrane protein